jgi:hypothetical protein
LNYKSLKVEPVLEGQWLSFEVTNVGNVDLELLMLEFSVPGTARRHPFVTPAELDLKGIAPRDGHPYIWFACYSPRGAYGVF